MTKILVIDDDPNTTQLLELILTKAGYTTAAVNNGPDGIAAVKTDAPEAILLDLMMPGMDGLEVCRNLRADAAFSKLPIIFLTALGDIDMKVAAYEAGANDFITKPVHPEELRLKIKAALGAHRQNNE